MDTNPRENKTLLETSMFHIATNAPDTRDVTNGDKCTSEQHSIFHIAINVPDNRDVANGFKYTSEQDPLRNLSTSRHTRRILAKWKLGVNIASNAPDNRNVENGTNTQVNNTLSETSSFKIATNAPDTRDVENDDAYASDKRNIVRNRNFQHRD